MYIPIYVYTNICICRTNYDDDAHVKYVGIAKCCALSINIAQYDIANSYFYHSMPFIDR